MVFYRSEFSCCHLAMIFLSLAELGPAGGWSVYAVPHILRVSGMSYFLV